MLQELETGFCPHVAELFDPPYHKMQLCRLPGKEGWTIRLPNGFDVLHGFVWS